VGNVTTLPGPPPLTLTLERCLFLLPLTGLSDLTGDSAMLTKLKPSGRGDSFLPREGEPSRPSGEASGDPASCMPAMNTKVASNSEGGQQGTE